MVTMYSRFQNTLEVQRQWHEQFDSDPPSDTTISRTYHKFLETGSVAD